MVASPEIHLYVGIVLTGSHHQVSVLAKRVLDIILLCRVVHGEPVGIVFLISHTLGISIIRIYRLRVVHRRLCAKQVVHELEFGSRGFNLTAINILQVVMLAHIEGYHVTVLPQYIPVVIDYRARGIALTGFAARSGMDTLRGIGFLALDKLLQFCKLLATIE